MTADAQLTLDQALPRSPAPAPQAIRRRPELDGPLVETCFGRIRRLPSPNWTAADEHWCRIAARLGRLYLGGTWEPDPVPVAAAGARTWRDGRRVVHLTRRAGVGWRTWANWPDAHVPGGRDYVYSRPLPTAREACEWMAARRPWVRVDARAAGEV